MKHSIQRLACVATLAGGLIGASTAGAATTIAVFDEEFYLDGLFAWSDAIVLSEPDGYSITDTGYGSGYKDISPNIDATGETTIELIVTVSGNPDEPDGPVSGPIVKLVDDDITEWEYAWYGLTNGTHVLTMPLDTPTYKPGAGTEPGLDLSNLSFFHLQNDPGAYTGEYTIIFRSFRLIGAPPLAITSQSYNPETQEFTLTWNSLPNRTYTVLHTTDLATPFAPLHSGILSGGTNTTHILQLPTADAGFLQVQVE
jgi:hypothetical protein